MDIFLRGEIESNLSEIEGFYPPITEKMRKLAGRAMVLDVEEGCSMHTSRILQTLKSEEFLRAWERRRTNSRRACIQRTQSDATSDSGSNGGYALHRRFSIDSAPSSDGLYHLF